MLTIFDNLNQERYRAFKNYPKYILKLNSLISKVGIKKIINKPQIIPYEEFFYEEPTMLIKGEPDNPVKSLSYSEEVYLFLSDSGFHHVPSSYNIPCHEFNEIKIKLSLEGRSKTITAGFYIKNRNAVIISLPIFDYEWDTNPIIAFSIIEQIASELKKLKIKKVNIEKEMIKARIEKFMKSAKSEIIKLESNISEQQNFIENCGQDLVKANKAMLSYHSRVKSLRELIKNQFKILAKKMEEIKKLPFVKRAQITVKGLMVDIGTVDLKYNNETITLGRYRIYINPDSVRIFNFDAIKDSSVYRDHPHVKDSKPCFNEWNAKIYTLLSKLELKNLTLMIKLYLQKYNDDSPYMNWESWNEYRKTQELRLKDRSPEPGEERAYVNKIRDKKHKAAPDEQSVVISDAVFDEE